jgi:hypothetical protein
VAVVPDSAGEVDQDVTGVERDPVDAAVEQSMGDGVPGCRATRQVLVCHHPDPLRILLGHGTMVFAVSRTVP